MTLADLLAQEPTRASVTGLPKARPAAPLGTATLRVGSGERPTGDCTPAFPVGEGRPAAPAGAARVGTVAQAVRPPRLGGAGVGRNEARMGDAAAACPGPRSGAFAPRLDDARHAGVHVGHSKGHATHGVAADCHRSTRAGFSLPEWLVSAPFGMVPAAGGSAQGVEPWVGARRGLAGPPAPTFPSRFARPS